MIAALAARYRDLDIAEDAYSEACARAVSAWSEGGEPADAAAWLYRTADRCALDMLRKRKVRLRFGAEPIPQEGGEGTLNDDTTLIPDDRLRLIFICCHPAVAAEARAALTLRLVCGLGTAEIARAFLVAEPTLAQRLVRAKRKIAQAGVPFEVPGPEHWPERLDAVLSTIEVAYSKAHEDAAGAGPHAGYAREMLELTELLARLVPDEPDALALAALVRYAEARRPARTDIEGAMIPLSEQDPEQWDRVLIDRADFYLRRANKPGPPGARVLQAAIHGAWCGRKSLEQEPPWREVLALYDALLVRRDDPVVRLNRAVAVAEVHCVAAALAEVDALQGGGLADFLPYHALRADLLRRAGQMHEAAEAYSAALRLEPGPAERRWLERRQLELNPA